MSEDTYRDQYLAEQDMRQTMQQEVNRLEAERNELAAHVERLQSVLTEIGDDYAQFGNIQDRTWAELDAAASDRPTTSLAALKAQWQAEALEAISQRNYYQDSGADFTDSVNAEAKRLRHQAEGK